jgi:uncharacterized protein YfdQ (DUF2303 family)
MPAPSRRNGSNGRALPGKQMNQIQFAEFIEANVPDITSTTASEPSGAEMLEVAINFKAQKKVNFASGQVLANGQVDFKYQEEIQGSAGANGNIKVPERFFIGIPVFEGGDPYKLEAKLRWALNDGKLTMWFELVRDQRFLKRPFRISGRSSPKKHRPPFIAALWAKSNCARS